MSPGLTPIWLKRTKSSSRSDIHHSFRTEAETALFLRSSFLLKKNLSVVSVFCFSLILSVISGGAAGEEVGCGAFFLSLFFLFPDSQGMEREKEMRGVGKEYFFPASRFFCSREMVCFLIHIVKRGEGGEAAPLVGKSRGLLREAIIQRGQDRMKPCSPGQWRAAVERRRMKVGLG